MAYGVTHSHDTAMIWVVDPNRLWAVGTNVDSGWYAGGSNHIDCYLSTGKWRFVMAGGDPWPHGGSGHLIAIPASFVGPPGRVPSSLGLSLSELLSNLFLFDGLGQAEGASSLTASRELLPWCETLCGLSSRLQGAFP